MSRHLLVVTVLALSGVAGLCHGQLYVQPPHAPGTPGGMAPSGFQGNQGTPGSNSDRELADDFVVTGGSWQVSRVTSSWLRTNPSDTAPVTGVQISFYEGTNGVIGELLAKTIVTNFSVSPGPGTYFSRPELVLVVDFVPILLTAGRKFVHIQPVVNHNWLWVSSSPTTPISGSPAQIRRNPYAQRSVNDANWPAVWTPSGNGNPVFPTAFDLSFTLHNFARP